MIDKQAGRQLGISTDRQTDRQTDKQTDRQTGRQTDRQTDRQAGRQTEPTCVRRRQLNTPACRGEKQVLHEPTLRSSHRPPLLYALVIPESLVTCATLFPIELPNRPTMTRSKIEICQVCYRGKSSQAPSSIQAARPEQRLCLQGSCVYC